MKSNLGTYYIEYNRNEWIVTSLFQVLSTTLCILELQVVDLVGLLQNIFSAAFLRLNIFICHRIDLMWNQIQFKISDKSDLRTLELAVEQWLGWQWLPEYALGRNANVLLSCERKLAVCRASANVAVVYKLVVLTLQLSALCSIAVNHLDNSSPLFLLSFIFASWGMNNVNWTSSKYTSITIDSNKKTL